MDESTATHIDELSRRVNDYARRITTLETLVMTLSDRLLELEAKKPKSMLDLKINCDAFDGVEAKRHE